jgi:SAM-dependent methyltransferase
MPNAALQGKWDGIHAQAPAGAPPAAHVLLANAHLLPSSGKALDLACGLGGNALFLARRGLAVTAWDISPIAIARLKAQAQHLRLNLDAQARDVELEPLPQGAFDVIAVSRFLSRALAAPLLGSLKPGGLLFYQTYTRDKLSPAGPSNPDYLLAENELLRLFSGLRILYYREDSRCGDLALGMRDEAGMVGVKR